jgi:hypothetical protein
MSALAVFAIGCAGVMLAAAGVMAVLLRPLAAALEELCGTRERGEFWTALSGVSLAVGSLLLGLLGFWWGQIHPAPAERHSAEDGTLFWSGVGRVRWAAAGILLGLAAVAEIVLAFTARMARGAQCPPAAQTEG